MKIVGIILLLFVLLIGGCWGEQKSPVYYKSPEVSAIFFDAVTKKPVEGVSVRVQWGALHSESTHHTDLKYLHLATGVSDQNGIVKIPAWGPVGATKEWRYYDWEPSISFTKPGYKYHFFDNHNNQQGVTSGALPYSTVVLQPPSWDKQQIPLIPGEGNAMAGDEDEIAR